MNETQYLGDLTEIDQEIEDRMSDAYWMGYHMAHRIDCHVSDCMRKVGVHYYVRSEQSRADCWLASDL